MSQGYLAGSAYIDLSVDLSGLISGLGQAKQLTASSMASIQAQMSTTTPAANALGAAVTGMFQGAGMAAFREGLRDIEAGFGAAEDAVIGFNSHLEQSAIGWQALLKKTGISAQQMMGEIQQIANVTPFRFQGLEENSRQLLAMGFNAKQVLPTMIDIGNAVSALGLGQQGIDTVTRALGEMNTATVVHARQVMMLTQAGVPAWQLLADATGKSVAEVRKLSEAGQISSDVFITAFREWSRANFGDAMANQAHTFQGAMSTIADVAQFAAATAFKPLFDGISQFAQLIAQVAQTDAFQRWVQSVAVVVGNVVVDVTAFGSVLLDLFGIKLPSATDLSGAALAKYTSQAIVANHTTDQSTTSVKDLKKELADAKREYDDFAKASVTGSKKFADALFAIGQKQAQANLDLLTFKTPGGALDQLLKPIQTQIDAADASLKGYKSDLDEINSFVEDQTRVVQEATDAQKAYDDAVGAAKDNLSAQQDRLSALQDVYNNLGDAIKSAQHDMEDLRHTALVGEGALSDQLFTMEQRVKQQQLRIAELELRGAGKKEIEAARKELDRLRTQEEAAQLRGEIRYDPQHRALEQQGVPRNEQTFEKASHDIEQYRTGIEGLTQAQQEAGQAVENQKTVVRDAMFDVMDASAVQRDHAAAVQEDKDVLEKLKITQADINKQYDEQKTKLADLITLYKKTEADAVKPLEDAVKRLNDEASKTKLQEQLALGPLRDQVNDVLHPLNEMSSDAIRNGLEATRKKIADIQAQIDKAQPDETGIATGGTAPAGPVDTTHDARLSGPAAPSGMAAATKAFANFGKSVDDVKASMGGFADWMRTNFPGIVAQPTHLSDTMRETRDTTKMTNAEMIASIKQHGDALAVGMNQNQANANAWGEWMHDHWGPTIVGVFTTVDDNFTHFVTVSMPALWTTLKKDATGTADELAAKWKALWDEHNKGGILGSWITGLGDLSTRFNTWNNEAAGKDGWLFKDMNAWGKSMVDAWQDGIANEWAEFQSFIGAKLASMADLLPDWAKKMFGITPLTGPSGGGGSMWGGGRANPNAINTILQGTGLAGQGDTIARLAAQYNVPPELALAMFRKEAGFAAPGSAAAANNNPGNLRGSPLESSERNGFAVFKDMATGIEAYFKLLNDNYRQFLDKGDIGGLINKYAPPSENNTAQYIQQITDWIKSIAAAIGTATGVSGTAGTIGNGIMADDPRPSQYGIDTVVPGAHLGDTYDADRGALGVHGGLDLQITNGTPVHVPLDLTDIRVGYYADAARRGYYVTGIDQYGREWYFGHMTAVNVKNGGSIAKGGIIGTVGMGHVHVQLKQHPGDITPIDPSAALDSAAASGAGPGAGAPDPYTAQTASSAYQPQNYSIGGPRYGTPIATGITGVTAAIVGLLPNLDNLIRAVEGVGAVAEDTAAGMVNATDDILQHATYKNRDGSDHFGYLNQNGGLSSAGMVRKDGTGMSVGGPHFGIPIVGPGAGMSTVGPTMDTIASVGTAVAGLPDVTAQSFDGVAKLMPVWNDTWTTFGDTTIAALQRSEDFAQGASANIIAYINTAIQRIDDLIGKILSIPGIHVPTGPSQRDPGGVAGPGQPGGTGGDTNNFNFYTRDGHRIVRHLRQLGYG